MSDNVDLNVRSGPDSLLVEIAEYVSTYNIESDLALETAKNCLIDTIGCGLLALKFPACTKMLGPIVNDTKVPYGVRVPGTNFLLDPVKGAFDIGCTIRWLDFNDTWLAAEWGHPSDNLGAILATADFISQKNISEGKDPLTMQDVLEEMVKQCRVATQQLLAYTHHKDININKLINNSMYNLILNAYGRRYTTSSISVE